MDYTINGIKIKTGTGRTGYFGSHFSPLLRGHDALPFRASAGFPTNPVLVKLINDLRPGTDPSFPVHLGYYDDSRKAAYVAALYHKNPEIMLRKAIATGGNIKDIDFPKELFDLPVHLTLEQAHRLLNNRGVKIAKTAKTTTARAKRVVINEIDDRSANTNFDVLHSKYNINDLVIRFGKETVLVARKTLTINEFELRFGL